MTIIVIITMIMIMIMIIITMLACAVPAHIKESKGLARSGDDQFIAKRR